MAAKTLAESLKSANDGRSVAENTDDKKRSRKSKPKPATTTNPPSRTNAAQMGFWIDRQAHKQLKLLGLQEERSIQSLGIEAINMLFAKYRLPEIADPNKD